MDRAIEYARIFKRQHTERFEDRDNADRYAAEQLASQDPRALAHNIAVLIERPQHPAAAFNALNELAQKFLREHRAFPPALATWTADVLAGKVKRPRAGQKHKGLRDTIVVICVCTTAEKFGIPATRNESSNPDSACDAAAQAWGLPYKTVEDIWNKRPR